MTTRERATALAERFRKVYPDAHCELDFKNPLQLLVATILSAQCTDKRVNVVTPGLFKKYRDARAFAQAKPATFESEIRSTGFFRSKTKSILGACQAIVAKHDGRVMRAARGRTKDGERRPRQCFFEERGNRGRYSRHSFVAAF
jgi:endonuclease-3